MKNMGSHTGVKVCKFPDNIGFESVPGYFNSFNMNPEYERVVFDLTETHFFHLSFVGFLLHAKSSIEKNDTVFEMLLSKRSADILKMIDVYDHFCGSSYEADAVISA